MLMPLAGRKTRGLLLCLWRYAEHRAILLWLGRGEALAPSLSPPDSDCGTNEAEREQAGRGRVVTRREVK